MFSVACKKFFQIKVEFDVPILLKIGFLFSHPYGNPVKISSKYEKLCDFCYLYGRIDYSINSCGELESLSVINYGSDLRVDP